MHPSRGERYYMDQQRQLWEMQVAHAQAVASAAAHAAALAGSHATPAHVEEHMDYSENTLAIGDLEFTNADPTAKPKSITLPGHYGTALSLVASISIENRRRDATDGDSLSAWFVTSVNGEQWMTVDGPGDNGFRDLSLAKPTASWRLHGPLGDRLTLRLLCSNAGDDYRRRQSGLWTGVRLSYGIQSV